MLKRIKGLLKEFARLPRDVREIKRQEVLQTRILQEQYAKQLMADERYGDPLRLQRYEHQVFSQHGEDGSIAEIFSRIGTFNKRFVEIGVDPLESNTTCLLYQEWSGLWVDKGLEDSLRIPPAIQDLIGGGRVKTRAVFVDKDNVESILEQAGIEPEFDLLSIDVDQNTYHLWEALGAYSPRVVVVEYNATFPPGDDWKAAYEADRVWDGTHYFGASLKAFEKLGTQKGYCLVGCETNGANAFFVRRDLVGDHFSTPYSAENHYEPPRYYLTRTHGHPRGFGRS